MTPEPDPEYYGTARFNGMAFELYRAVWTDKGRKHWAWYAKHEGQAEGEFQGTRSKGPAEAIGHAVLASDENADLADRLFN